MSHLILSPIHQAKNPEAVTDAPCGQPPWLVLLTLAAYREPPISHLYVTIERSSLCISVENKCLSTHFLLTHLKKLTMPSSLTTTVQETIPPHPLA